MSILKLDDTVQDVIKKMSEMTFGGFNPGAATVMIEMISSGSKIDPQDAFGGLGAILMMDGFGIRGERIWMLYKDVCKEDLVKTIGMLRACQLGFIGPNQLICAIDDFGRGVDIDDCMKKSESNCQSL